MAKIIKASLYNLARNKEHIETRSQWEKMMTQVESSNMTYIDGANIATGTIYGRSIVAGSITADEIHAGSISADHIAADGLVADVIKGGILQSIAPTNKTGSIIDLNTGDFSLAGGKITWDGQNLYIDVSTITIDNKNVVTQDQITDVVRNNDIQNVVRDTDIVDVIRTGDIRDVVRKNEIANVVRDTDILGWVHADDISNVVRDEDILDMLRNDDDLPSFINQKLEADIAAGKPITRIEGGSLHFTNDVLIDVGFINKLVADDVFIANLIAEEAFIEYIRTRVINADYITAGTLDVSKFTVENFTGEMITSGKIEQAGPIKNSYFNLNDGTFRVGNANSYLYWDGSNLRISGPVRIGNQNIELDQMIQSVTTEFGLSDEINTEPIVFQSNRPDRTSGQYIWEKRTTLKGNGQEIVVIVNVTGDKGDSGERGQPGSGGKAAITGQLSNDSHTITMDENGQNGNYTGASSQLTIYEGGQNVSSLWTVSVQQDTGIVGTFNASTKTYTLTSLSVNSGKVTFTATRSGYDNVVKVFSLARVLQGKMGASAVTYLLQTDTVYFQRDSEQNKLTPLKAELKGVQVIGNELPALQAGYFIVYEQGREAITVDAYSDLSFKSLVDLQKEYILSNNEFPYTQTYRSLMPESSIIYRPGDNVKKVYIEWYKDALLTELLDIEEIPIVSDGKDVYKTEIHSLNGNTFKNGIIDTWLYAVVYKGDTDVTATIDANRFKWTRMSADTASDILWNNRYFSGMKQIKVTEQDVYQRATFNCDILK